MVAKSSQAESERAEPEVTTRAGTNDAQSAAPKNESKSGLNSWSSSIEAGRKMVLNVFMVALVLIAISVVGKATMTRGIIIQPISVPKEMSEQGYTSEAVAQQIADEIVRIVGDQETSRLLGILSTSSIETTMPKIDLPGSGVTISSIVYYLRDFFGFSDTKISGEITVEGRLPNSGTDKESRKTLPIYLLRLRIVDRGFVYEETQPTQDLRVLFRRAALPLLEEINPYIAGLHYMHQKDFVGATRMAALSLRRANSVDQEWALNLVGLIAENQKRLDVAIAEHRKAIERFPHFPLPWYNLAHVYLGLERYQESLAAALEGVSIDQDNKRRAIGYNTAGSALTQMRKHNIELDFDSKTIKLIAQVLRRNEIGADEKSMLRSGQVPRPEIAIAMYRQATQSDATYDTAYRNWGQIERDRGNLIEAIRLFEMAIAARPKVPFGYADMGSLHLSEREWDKAAEYFKKAIQLNAKSSYYHSSLGRALAGSGKFKEAIEEYKMALELDPTYAWSHIRWAQALAAQSKQETQETAAITKEEAANQLKLALEKLPNNPQALLLVAETYEALGMTQEAVTRTEDAAAKPPPAVGSITDSVSEKAPPPQADVAPLQ